MNIEALPKLLVPALLFTFASCSMREQPAAGATGAEIYKASACATCHGEDLSGTGLAPTLVGLSANWTPDALAKFLGSPDPARVRSSRQAKLDLEFSADMPTYDNLSAEELIRLAGFLLAE